MTVCNSPTGVELRGQEGGLRSNEESGDSEPSPGCVYRRIVRYPTGALDAIPPDQQ